MNFRQGDRERTRQKRRRRRISFSFLFHRQKKRKKVLRRKRRRRKNEECHHSFLTIHLFPFSFPFLWANRGKTLLTDISLGSIVEHRHIWSSVCRWSAFDGEREEDNDPFFRRRWQVSMVRRSPMKHWPISSWSIRWSPAPDVHTIRRRNFSSWPNGD